MHAMLATLVVALIKHQLHSARVQLPGDVLWCARRVKVYIGRPLLAQVFVEDDCKVPRLPSDLGASVTARSL